LSISFTYSFLRIRFKKDFWKYLKLEEEDDLVIVGRNGQEVIHCLSLYEIAKNELVHYKTYDYEWKFGSVKSIYTYHLKMISHSRDGKSVELKSIINSDSLEGILDHKEAIRHLFRKSHNFKVTEIEHTNRKKKDKIVLFNSSTYYYCNIFDLNY
jgi:hypothetical protein